MTRAVCSWSGGKDAAYTLYEIQQTDDVAVEGLLTTVSTETNRSSMHGVRRELYNRQSEALGFPIEFVTLPAEATNEAYEEAMAEVMAECANRGIERVAFADLYLEDVRTYREKRLSGSDIEGYWPLWGRDTSALAVEFIESFSATVVCVDGEALDSSFAGREFDAEFLDDLPAEVDPCGENGEFHTFVWDGAIFEDSVNVRTGETVTREIGDSEFHYCDLLTGE
jgi:uncharacterized protein (TIGR00290 family)